MTPRPQRAAALTLGPACVAQLLAEAWSRWPLETGGLLLGTEPLGVRQVVGPGPGAKHNPTGFEPDDAWQAEAVARRWTEDRELSYLGDWHTHPKGKAVPSALDAETMRLIAGHAPARQPQPVMLILACDAAGVTKWGAVRLVGGRVQRLRLRIAEVPRDFDTASPPEQTT